MFACSPTFSLSETGSVASSRHVRESRKTERERDALRRDQVSHVIMARGGAHVICRSGIIDNPAPTRPDKTHVRSACFARNQIRPIYRRFKSEKLEKESLT
jgi:hypothetical protein